MVGTQLLRALVNERLAAAAEEILGLVERTIAEHRDELVRSRRQVLRLKREVEQLAALKARMALFAPGLCEPAL